MFSPRTYADVPEIVSGYPLDAWWAVVVPPTVDITNLVTNPSYEVNTTGATAVGGSVARSTTKQRRGGYSLAVTPTAGVNDGFFFGTVSVAAGGIYPWSFDFWGNGGIPYKAYWATTGGVQVGSAVSFRGKSRWERILVPYIETTSTTRRLYIVKDNSASTAVFYVDGMLVPSPVTEQYVWRYFDGDSVGFVPNQVDFYWSGTAHGSTSIMRANTRAGGKIVPLTEFGFILTAMLGLGLAAPNNIAIPLALPGGMQYQRTLAPAPAFDLVGYQLGTTQADLNRKHSDLKDALDVRRQPITQPIILQYAPVDQCGDTIGETAEIVCSLAGGLEGIRDNHYQENFDLKFQTYLPAIAKLAGNEGAALATSITLASSSAIRRSPAGIWTTIAGGVMTGAVYVTLPLADGRWLLGGSFLNINGDGNADNLVYYDPATDTVATVNATPLNGDVFALLQLPSGNVLVGGNFTNAGGDANADYLCLLTIATGVYSSLNATPLNAYVAALELLPTGNVLLGGNFTNIISANGDYMLLLTVSTGAYSVINATPLSSYVNTIELGLDNIIYFGGAFLNAGGAASADYIAKMVGPAYNVYAPINPSAGATVLNNEVKVIVAQSNGNMLVGGFFTNIANGYNRLTAIIDVYYDLLIPNILGGSVFSAFELLPGTFIVGGDMSTVNDFPTNLFQFRGTTVLPLDLTSTARVLGMDGRASGEMMLGYAVPSAPVTSGTTVVTNSGSANTLPTIVLKYSTAATVVAPLYSMRNLTTGKVITFSLSLLPGETVVVNVAANMIVSDLRGNLNSAVVPGSNLATFFLAPGANTLNIFVSSAAGANITAYAYWEPQYSDLSDLNE